MRIVGTCLIFILAVAALPAQAPGPLLPPEPERAMAISAMRMLNTAEMNFAAGAHHFGSFDDLRPVLAQWKADGRTHSFAGAVNALDLNGPDPLPGWELRVTVAADGLHYSLAVRNGRYCDVNAFSDENGIIYT